MTKQTDKWEEEYLKLPFPHESDCAWVARNYNQCDCQRKTYIEICKQFIKQTLKSQEEDFKKVLRDIESKIMNIELAVDKETIKKIEALNSKAEVVGYTQGIIFRQLENIFKNYK